MPLKVDDLKTVESYKKAVKQEAAKISASVKTKFWIYKDVELPTATGGKQKLPALIALVDDTAAKTMLKGKQPWCRGTCELEGGKIAFEAAQGKLPYAVLVKSVPLLLGKMVHIPAGVDPESDGEENAAPPPPPAGNDAQLIAVWKQLSHEASEKMAANPALRDPLTRAMAGIPEMLHAGQFGEAGKHLQQLQAILKATAAGSYPGLVKYRTALVQFAQARSEALQQIRGLEQAIVAKLPREASFAKSLADEIDALSEELAGAVDEAMKGAENQASPATDKIKLKIRKYTTELSSNRLVQRADSNPFGVPVTIGKTLGGALARIRDAMPA